MEGGYISSVQTTPHASPTKRHAESPLELEFPSSQPNAAIENARALLKELAALKFGPPSLRGFFFNLFINYLYILLYNIQL